MRKFDIPEKYKSSFIARLKEFRKKEDKRKKDFTPTVIKLGDVEILLARHFGFCYGVENAIEVSYRAIEENPNKNIFLLSQMIHNPVVNDDLIQRGIRFMSDTMGNRLMDWNSLKPGDIVIVPAFGATIEIMNELEAIGVDIHSYNTTCPFVEKVWTRSNALGDTGHTIIIHGKYKHEETRATFSHSKSKAPAVVIFNMDEAVLLASYITENKTQEEFEIDFKEKFTPGFSISEDLKKVGVVNQTTMLATETQEIANFFRDQMVEKFGVEKIKDHFADTKDTLCYATNDNQQATLGLLNSSADVAFVVGGYNSSNTSHIVEILEDHFPTYFINSPNSLETRDVINHFDYPNKKHVTSQDYLPSKKPSRIIVTSGASCPDKIVEEVIEKILKYYSITHTIDEVINTMISEE